MTYTRPINVLPIGSPVTFDGIVMVISAISIRGRDHEIVRYECTFADGKSVKEVWFDSWLLHAAEPMTKLETIGFSNGVTHHA